MAPQKKALKKKAITAKAFKQKEDSFKKSSFPLREKPSQSRATGRHWLKIFEGFSKLNREQRLKKLLQNGILSKEDIERLSACAVFQNPSQNPKGQEGLSEHLIENSIGWMALPLGLAVNFVINGRGFALPLAIEESSVIAGASKTARWIAQSGSLTFKILGSCSTGQIHIPKVKNPEKLKMSAAKHFPKWQSLAHRKGPLRRMAQRGGGLKDFEVRLLKRADGAFMGVLHLYIDACSAMGANIINQFCEFIKPFVEQDLGERLGICILSNLPDRRMVKAQAVLKNQDPGLIQKIEEASVFAETDPYRAVTSNKGVLNGIEALAIATGNDWRAVSSGLHAHCSRKVSYSSLTRWRAKGQSLYGEMTAPFMLGVTGGMTSLHPIARLSLKILGSPSAGELAGLCCALGLAQNLCALKALVTQGITQGHIKLHLKNFILKSGAKTQRERGLLEQSLLKSLKKNKSLTLSHAEEALRLIRKNAK